MSTTPDPSAATATVLSFPSPTPAERKRSQDLWTAPVIECGYTVLPTLLMQAQARLGLNADEMNTLLQLISYRWSADTHPRPAKATIAQRIGRSPRTVQRYLTSLENKGLVARIERFKAHKGQDANGYDLSGLVRRLGELAPEFKKAAEQNKLRRAKVEAPKSG
jgi:predicted transcriptional regulator